MGSALLLAGNRRLMKGDSIISPILPLESDFWDMVYHQNPNRLLTEKEFVSTIALC
jgi:hypothetical protein